ncbi:MAG: hypothetical protein MUC87_21050 [Bacteroidia bacterium]|jgi:hypothetical protein|nr:hypothetical protein [Bacteroidia bacterium]
MNKILLLLIVLITSAFTPVREESSVADKANAGFVIEATAGDSVYVCLGSGAYAYHNTRNCRGLKQCKANIILVPIEKAQSMPRRPCGYCY